jgi:hypothetical protein
MMKNRNFPDIMKNTWKKSNLTKMKTNRNFVLEWKEILLDYICFFICISEDLSLVATTKNNDKIYGKVNELYEWLVT